MFRKSLLVFLVFLLVFFIYLYRQALQSSHLAASPFLPISSMETRLKPCPNSPNCVSTQSTQADKKRAPLSFSDTPAAALSRLQKIVEAMPRTQLIEATPHYLHFTFKTWPIPFVDDVAFLLDPATKVIHYRSSSRVGYSDFGVNSRRMAKITKQWESTQ